MKKIGFIFGTRPEVIKCVPVILAARKQNLETLIVFTGQHLEMALPILSFFDIEIDINLKVMKKGQSLVEMSTNLLSELAKYSDEINTCDVMMVQGDTTSSFVGGYYCFLNKIPLGHIEAGLRTYNLDSPFPEEGNRQLISKLANFHFAPTESAVNNLKQEKVDADEIFLVGNTGIDTLIATSENFTKELSSKTLESLGINSKQEFVLITGHRRENIGIGFNQICESIEILSKKYKDINFVYPVHMNPKVSDAVHQKLGHIENVKLIKPLGYIEFVALLKECRLVMSDSGGVQEEAPSFQKPIIVLRDTTERPEGIELGIAKLCGTDQEKILSAFEFFYHNKDSHNITNPYGSGNASKEIIKLLESHFKGN